MARNDRLSRRTALKLTGAAALTATVAGCSSGDDDGDDGGNGDDGYEIEAGETITLEGETTGWIGSTPSEIEGVENPTLVLEDGEEYEIGWEQGDGGEHNVVLWDENEEPVGEYYTGDDPTDTTDSPGDDDFFTFTASDEIAYYRCDPHPNMQGSIEVE